MVRAGQSLQASLIEEEVVTPYYSKKAFSLPLIFSLALSLVIMLLPSAQAAVTIHLGPAAVGGGGPNPISIPPTNPLDYEVVWRRSNGGEWSFSLFPGVFYGLRAVMLGGGYISAGGGLVSNMQGISPGLYSAFGYDACAWLCFNIEYKQAIGFFKGMMISPYALRVGVTLFTP